MGVAIPLDMPHKRDYRIDLTNMTPLEVTIDKKKLWILHFVSFTVSFFYASFRANLLSLYSHQSTSSITIIENTYCTTFDNQDIILINIVNELAMERTGS